MKRFVTFAILILTFTTSVQARAWGVHFQMDWKEFRGALLSMKVLKNHKIDYCVELVSDFKTVPNSINQQIEAGLTMWLNPVIKTINHTVDIDSVPCGDPRMDLKVVVGHFSDMPINAMGRTKFEGLANNGYEKIQINLDSQMQSTVNNGVVKESDFAFLLPSNIGLDKMLDILTDGPLLSVDDYSNKYLANKRDLNGDDVYMSTLNTLLHELGHSLGLCHTYELGSCSKTERLDLPVEQQPESVMKKGNFLNLTADDIIGIKRLFELARLHLFEKP